MTIKPATNLTDAQAKATNLAGLLEGLAMLMNDHLGTGSLTAQSAIIATAETAREMSDNLAADLDVILSAQT